MSDVIVVKGITPEKQHSSDAAADLISCEATNLHLYPGGFGLVKTGSFVAIPKNHVGLVCPRSGLAAKHGVTVLNAPGVIDPGYRGEIGVVLANFGQYVFTVKPGDRIAQLLIMPIRSGGFLNHAPLFDELSNTDRGGNGFGSTGISVHPALCDPDEAA